VGQISTHCRKSVVEACLEQVLVQAKKRAVIGASVSEDSTFVHVSQWARFGTYWLAHPLTGVHRRVDQGGLCA
jgi:hypothetical protein